MRENCDVVLLQPPFFRTAGSHNNRPILELCYASRWLERAGISHVVLNADYEATSVHNPWRSLFENHELFDEACDGHSPLFEICVEQVMQFRPRMVFVACGDSLIPTKNVGSPYLAYHVAKRLSPYAKVVGCGPAFAGEPFAFRDAFDGFARGPLNRSVVKMALGGEYSGGEEPWDVIPEFRYVRPQPQISDYVLSSFGCAFRCGFCLAPVVWDGVRYRAAEDFAADVHVRSMLLGRTSLYLADMYLPASTEHLKGLVAALGPGRDYRFVCESRLEVLSEEKAGLMKALGIELVKLGVESLDDRVLERMNKKQDSRGIRDAIRSFHAHGFKVVGYLLFGSFYEGDVEAMRRTVEEAASMREVSYWVINVEAYKRLDWSCRYDAHFSVTAAGQQGVPQEVLFEALDTLQSVGTNPTVEVLGAAG
jgi:pyruvate-formate lyase-activating enzyme